METILIPVALLCSFIFALASLFFSLRLAKVFSHQK